MEKQKRSRIEDRLYTCKKCGKVKEAKSPSQKREFCSFKCSNQWKWDNVRNNQRKEILKCYECGKDVKHSKNREIKEGIFCSKKCFYLFRKENPPNWLIPIKKGSIPWNKGKVLPKEFSIKCKKRAEEQWRNKEFRDKQEKRDLSYLPKLGEIALRKWREEHPEEVIIAQAKAGKILQDRYLKKLGVLIDEN